MNRIAALIDFTPATDVVINFAKGLAKSKNTAVVLIHITDNTDNSEAQSRMNDMASQFKNEGLHAEAVVQSGSFFSMIRQVLVRERVTMAIIGTHGKKGFKQNLFGSNILKLVKMIGMPALVVQENSVYPPNGFHDVLIPVGSHTDYEMKMRHTCSILNIGAKTTSYAIYKTDELEEDVRKNLNKSVSYLLDAGMNAEIIQEEANRLSIGYSLQTLDYLKKNPHSLVSIMTKVAPNSKYYGDVDKENVILNPMGIPVLCCDE